jgi:hypothetical protein
MPSGEKSKCKTYRNDLHHAIALLAEALCYNGSVPDEVNGFFSLHLIVPAALGPGIDSASNRNEHQESSCD